MTRVPEQPGKPARRKPKPPAAKPARYGTREAAGPFAGVGLMLGSNEDVWKQALRLAKDGLLDVVAVTPVFSLDWTGFFKKAGTETVLWAPPEAMPANGWWPLVEDKGFIAQAESQPQWDQAIRSISLVRERTSPDFPCGIVANWWGYGQYPPHTVALVEVYANEVGVGVDFGVFARYMEAGAAAVIAVPGIYHAGMDDEIAAAYYAGLPADLSGVMGFCGESPATEASLAALRSWKAKAK